MNLPNIQIKKILYATDLSESAVHAFSYAISFAGAYDAGITMLHVVSESSSEQFISSMISSKTLREIKDRHYSEARENMIGKRREYAAIKDVLHAFSEEVNANNSHSFSTEGILIEEGPPAETIVKTAKSQDCDLIVMGTHGQGGITELLTGSTAKKVIKLSSIPVLVIQLPKEKK
jgi:ACR3 family arsenite transporter